jgi:hypothetical protein
LDRTQERGSNDASSWDVKTAAACNAALMMHIFLMQCSVMTCQTVWQSLHMLPWQLAIENMEPVIAHFLFLEEHSLELHFQFLVQVENPVKPFHQ